MQVQLEVEKRVLVSIRDPEILELIREFVEPLGYSAEFASDAAPSASQLIETGHRPVPVQ